MPEPLKVGLIWPWVLVGGSESWVLGLARNADPARLRFTGLALPEWGVEDPAMVREILRYMPVYAGPAKPPHQAAPGVLRPGPDASHGIAAVAGQADCLMASEVPLLPVMTEAYRRRGTPVVLVSHTEGPENSLVNLEAGATHFSAVCAAGVKTYSQQRRPHVRVIHNGAEPGRCAPRAGREATRASLGFTPRDLVVSFLGRCSWEKNPLAASQAVRALGDPFKALYLRTGHALAGVQLAVAEACPGRVVFTDVRPQLGDLLAATDVLMAASHSEAMSLLILEAWLAGVPVVATPVGALPELQDRLGQLVVLVDHNPTPEQLAEAVVHAMSRANRPVVEHARWAAWEHFTAGRCADDWTRYLEEVCGRAG